MHKKLYLLFAFCFITINSFSQDYFQQEVNYEINVSLDDKKHELSAFENIEYINNSPETLTLIYFHIWPNAYKNNKTALVKQLVENGETDLYYAEKKDRGFIDSLDFKVNNESIKWVIDEKHIDIAILHLNQPLPPSGSINITTPFKVKIPKGVYSRFGHLGESYQMTQWYPKPAVYDKNGWHQMPYLDQGEFYSEYGTFDVKITLPKNYVVGATGDLVNDEIELAWLDSIVTETLKIDSFPDDMTIPKSSSELKTLHYHQDKIHDFAWFADKRFNVLKGAVKLPHSNNSVTTWAMFTNNEADVWTKSIEYLNDAIYYYSLWNGDYPYNHATAVDGINGAGTDMEYPNITVIGEGYDAIGLDDVIAHEVGHNWFYGILGSNERDHPWMDEGLNSFNEFRYMETKYPKLNLLYDTIPTFISNFGDINKYKYKYTNYLSYLINERTNFDQPIELGSEDYTYMNYGTIVYGKSAIAFDYLMAYLGKDVFDKCMLMYFETWKFKHPQPEDLKNIFENETGKTLDWFFKDVITTTNSIDYKLVSRDGDRIKVKNTGQIKAPFSISAIKNDSIITTKWYEGFEKTTLVSFPKLDYDKLKIDATNDIPETNRNNNTLKSKGVFKTIEPFRLQLIGSLDNPDKTQLFFTPIPGYNTADGFMLGGAFYNNVLPQKNFEYTIAPMYSFNSNTVVGSSKLSYHILGNKELFRQVSLNLVTNSFTYQSFSLGIEKSYYKIAPEVVFFINNQNKRSPLSQKLSIKGIFINEPTSTVNSGLEANIALSTQSSINNLYGVIDYNFKQKDAFKKWDNILSLEMNEEFAKIYLESKLDIPFKNEQKGIHFRLFTGKFLFNNSTISRYNFRMDGSSGYYDYKFDYLQLDRSYLSSPLSQHVIEDQGGFKTPTSLAQSNNWIVALNGKAELPIPLPLGVFADIGYRGSNQLVYEAGIYVFIIRNYLEFYMPLMYSENIKNTLGGKRPVELIRFTLNLNNANPFKLIKEFEF